MSATIVLKAGREKSLQRRHPWVFSNGISKVKGSPAEGDTVDVVASNGNWLARGAWSPHSQIRVRVWSFDQEQQIDRDFFRAKLERAQAARADLTASGVTDAVRLVASENDGLPGVTIDCYGKQLVCQFLSTGAEFWREVLIDLLQELYPEHAIYERSDSDSRQKEGMKLSRGPIKGDAPELLTIEEHGVKLLVDVAGGHKTGFYLDQRENRALLADYVKDKEVLNCFCYSGGFSMHALKAGAAHVTSVDMSQPALDLAEQSRELNGFDASRSEFVRDDVFKLLRKYRAEGRKFDVIVLDPPKFAESKAKLPGACRGYKDINMVAMQLLREGGTLMTYSCSGLLMPDLFQKIVADAALDAGREARIIKRLDQAMDHPVATPFPEGFYLKGLVLQVF